MEKWIPIQMSLVLTLILFINVSNSGLCFKPLDLVFIIDTSRSIWENDFNLQMKFVKKFVRSLEIGPNQTRVAAVTFSSEVYEEFKFDKYRTKKQVLHAIDGIRFTNGRATRTYRALKYTHDTIFAPGNGERPSASDVVIVLTDGKTNPGHYDHLWKERAKNKTQFEAAKIRAMPAKVFAIGVGSDVNIDELKSISSDPNDLYTFHISSFKEFNFGHVMDRIMYTACSSTIITHATPTQGTATPSIKSITSTQAPTSPLCADTKMADIFFVVDESTSIGNSFNFQKELTFVSSVINEFDIRQSNVRVGIMTFSNRPRILKRLNDYKTKSEIVEMLKTFSWTKGDTYLDEAIKILLRVGLSPMYGSRTDVPQIAVVITDGQSTNPSATERAISQLKQRNVKVYAIGVGQDLDRNELNKIATVKVFEVETVTALASLHSKLLTNLCANEGKTTSNPLTIKQITSTQWTTAPLCEDTMMADIFFVVDESSSLKFVKNFQTELKFVSSVITEFNITQSHVRVGIMTFGTTPRMLKRLNENKSKPEIIAMLKTIPWNGGNTYMDKAIQLLMSEGLNGSRTNVTRIAVIITDGQSTDPPATERAISQLKQRNIVVYAIG